MIPKYRIWSKLLNRFVTDLTLNNLANPEIDELNDVFENKNLIFQQWTGLKDENGTDLYEGDIVNSEDQGVLKIEWRKAYSGEKFCAVHKDSSELDFYGYIPEDIIIMGNILENPYLLE